jgi:CRP-like cAMP-binding protein
MDLKQVAKDTALALTSYITYQALKNVLAQISETNPPLALWLHGFSARHSIQNGEAYLQAMLQEQPEIALRIMTVRQHLAEQIAEYLPEMLQANIQKANMEHRRQHLERITQLADPAAPTEELKTEEE